MTILLIGLVISFIGIIVTGIRLKHLKYRLYFLRFKFEEHPQLAQLVEDTLYKICDEEQIGVFVKSDEELNKDITDEKKKVCGHYVYIADKNYEAYRKIISTVKDYERRYNMPFKDICNKLGNDCDYDEERFTYPRILICSKETHISKLLGYYSTFFHELGHHFAAIEMGEHNEDDANRYALKLVKERLPDFFVLIFEYSFVDSLEISDKERNNLYISYNNYMKFVTNPNTNS